MEAQKIDILIQKYLDAETSLKEESILSDYFNNNNNIEPHLEEYKILFSYFESEKLERYSKTINLPIKRNWNWVGMAASIVLIFGMYFGNGIYQRNEARIAYQQTNEAFTLIASNLNKGTKSIQYLGEFDKTRKKIFK